MNEACRNNIQSKAASRRIIFNNKSARGSECNQLGTGDSISYVLAMFNSNYNLTITIRTLVKCDVMVQIKPFTAQLFL